MKTTWINKWKDSGPREAAAMMSSLKEVSTSNASDYLFYQGFTCGTTSK